VVTLIFFPCDLINFVYRLHIYFFIYICISFINIEPSAVEEERDINSASTEENHENLTSLEQDLIRSATISGEMQNPDLSTTNTTMSSSLSTKLWNGLNIAKKIVCLSPNFKILIKPLATLI
jgi:hypothetical protein